MGSENIERVFILGAGVSKHCGYPLTTDLLREITLNADNENKFHVHNFIRFLYPNFNPAYSNYPNIEEVLSLLDVSIEMGSKIPPSRYNYYTPDVSEIKNRILKNIYTYLFEKLKAVDDKKAIYKFASRLILSDVVISFNWDLNLEKAFEDLQKNYSYYLKYHGGKERITILKPHGSINWFKRSEINIKNELKQPLIEGLNNSKIDVFKYFRPPKTTKDIIPYIVPPTIKKIIDTPELKRIWGDIYHVLSHASEINILGYSLPNIDLNSRYIFRTAIRENNNFKTTKRKRRQFFVVNPDDSVYLTYRNLVGDPIRFEQAKFEDLTFEQLFG